MENRAPSLLARLAQAVGLGANIPKPSGPLPVRSLHYRVPGSVLVQCFFPHIASTTTTTTTTALDADNTPGIGRTYRNGVIRGASEFGRVSHLLMRVVLEGSIHPLADNNRLVAPAAASCAPDDTTKYPVIVFSHGLGGSAEMYTKQCSDLASHGYVVIALEHEDGSGAHAKREDGELVPYTRPPSDIVYSNEEVAKFRAPFLAKRLVEIEAVLAHIRGGTWDVCQMMDLDRLVMAGHSFGSATAVYAARALPARTFRGLLLLDIWVLPLPQLDLGVGDEALPVCSILSEPFATNNEKPLTKQLLRAAGTQTLSFYLPGTVHSSFSDTPWWLPAWLGRRAGLVGRFDADRVQSTMLQVELGFLNEVCHQKKEDQQAVASMDEVERRLMGSCADLRVFPKD